MTSWQARSSLSNIS